MQLRHQRKISEFGRMKLGSLSKFVCWSKPVSLHIRTILKGGERMNNGQNEWKPIL